MKVEVEFDLKPLDRGFKKVYPQRFDEDDYMKFKIKCRENGFSPATVLGLFVKEFNKKENA